MPRLRFSRTLPFFFCAATVLLVSIWLRENAAVAAESASPPLDENATPPPPSSAEGEVIAEGEVPVLETERFGLASGFFIHRLIPSGRANDRSPWRQLVFFKKDQRTTRKSYFASVDFEKGTVRELPVCIPSLEAWSALWLDGKLYLGMNVMPRLAVYDPATDTLTDLGEPFPGPKPSATLYRMAATPEGMIALGGGTGTDLALYDPKTGKFASYGKIGGEGTDGGYVYYLSADDRYIYCAVRGTGPTELLAIHRETKARKVLASRPAAGWISVNGNLAEVTDEHKNKIYLLLENGGAEEITADQRGLRAKNADRPGFTGKGPEAILDDSPLAKGDLHFRVLIPEGGSTENFREGRIEAGLASEALIELAALPDGRIAGVARGYGPMLLADPQGARNELVTTRTSSYTVAAVGKNVFVAGYPGTRLVVYETSKPQTSTVTLPGKPGIPMEQADANPRLVASLMATTGGAHIGCCLTPASDGRVYLIARRHRYYYGFALAWADAEGRTTGVFEDQGAFNHYQIGWMSSADHGDTLLIATTVQYNKQLPGAAAEEGALFVFDVKSQKIVGKHIPLPRVKALLGVIQTAPDTAVGVGQLESGSSVLYRFNLKTGKTEQTRMVKAKVCGASRGDLAVPVRSNGFVLGPEGQVWTGATDENGWTLIFRINPKDLVCRPVGKIHEKYARLLFSNGELYTTGSSSVQRIKGWKEAAP
ncbi:MAG: hypothetical protein IT578_05440 [Verrucomicrobiae bacterium]|nr:hypothetical protein [Verrucomicrobiae bacterium]